MKPFVERLFSILERLKLTLYAIRPVGSAISKEGCVRF